MTATSVIHEELKDQGNKDRDLKWEEESYQKGCALARQEALKKLQTIEEQLYQNRPPFWQVEGWRERTLVTRFGDITVRRRLYRDERGDYHFLLDEYLGWSPAQAATPSLQESVVALAARTQFREVSKTLEKLTAGVLSTMTIHRLLQRTAQSAIEEEEKEWQACFEEGKMPPSEDRKVSPLYIEADGTWIHLQKEQKRHYEVKSAIAYEGWERIPQQAERYTLVNKRVYCQANEKMPFWEGASLEWSHIWDLSWPELVVIGGDDAGWIDEGVKELSKAVRHLSGFHLSRACRWGWEDGKVIYEAIRSGNKEAKELLSKIPIREGKRAEKAQRYVENHLEKGIDWRNQVKAPEGSRGLGAIESNQDKLVANRMKKRGMSWTIRGAQRMAKVIQLEANGEIKSWCGRRQPSKVSHTPHRPLSRRRSSDEQWLQASIPDLTALPTSDPWVQKLRALIYFDSHRLN